ncbi:hypothetical protein BDZ91DRAFT_784119 [Kalaharituber pfeilii]|nr:hypothetical protein BDZ91DRAFT_784119 [Kalaharituber pfeilii]
MPSITNLLEGWSPSPAQETTVTSEVPKPAAGENERNDLDSLQGGSQESRKGENDIERDAQGEPSRTAGRHDPRPAPEAPQASQTVVNQPTPQNLQPEESSWAANQPADQLTNRTVHATAGSERAGTNTTSSGSSLSTRPELTFHKGTNSQDQANNTDATQEDKDTDSGSNRNFEGSTIPSNAPASSGISCHLNGAISRTRRHSTSTCSTESHVASVRMPVAQRPRSASLLGLPNHISQTSSSAGRPPCSALTFGSFPPPQVAFSAPLEAEDSSQSPREPGIHARNETTPSPMRGTSPRGVMGNARSSQSPGSNQSSHPSTSLSSDGSARRNGTGHLNASSTSLDADFRITAEGILDGVRTVINSIMENDFLRPIALDALNQRFNTSSAQVAAETPVRPPARTASGMAFRQPTSATAASEILTYRHRNMPQRQRMNGNGNATIHPLATVLTPVNTGPAPTTGNTYTDGAYANQSGSNGAFYTNATALNPAGEVPGAQDPSSRAISPESTGESDAAGIPVTQQLDTLGTKNLFGLDLAIGGASRAPVANDPPQSVTEGGHGAAQGQGVQYGLAQAGPMASTATCPVTQMAEGRQASSTLQNQSVATTGASPSEMAVKEVMEALGNVNLNVGMVQIDIPDFRMEDEPEKTKNHQELLTNGDSIVPDEMGRLRRENAGDQFLMWLTRMLPWKEYEGTTMFNQLMYLGNPLTRSLEDIDLDLCEEEIEWLREKILVPGVRKLIVNEMLREEKNAELTAPAEQGDEGLGREEDIEGDFIVNASSCSGDRAVDDAIECQWSQQPRMEPFIRGMDAEIGENTEKSTNKGMYDLQCYYMDEFGMDFIGIGDIGGESAEEKEREGLASEGEAGTDDGACDEMGGDAGEGGGDGGGGEDAGQGGEGSGENGEDSDSDDEDEGKDDDGIYLENYDEEEEEEEEKDKEKEKEEEQEEQEEQEEEDSDGSDDTVRPPNSNESNKGEGRDDSVVNEFPAEEEVEITGVAEVRSEDDVEVRVVELKEREEREVVGGEEETEGEAGRLEEEDKGDDNVARLEEKEIDALLISLGGL